jgi:RNA recognition motif-containing protein
MSEDNLQLKMSDDQDESVRSDESPRDGVVDDVDAHNVFIKFLPTTLTDSGLYALFSQFGDIKSCRVMVDPITGNSLGYGFVLTSLRS